MHLRNTLKHSKYYNVVLSSVIGLENYQCPLQMRKWGYDLCKIPV
jgi:hypothetical protein